MNRLILSLGLILFGLSACDDSDEPVVSMDIPPLSAESLDELRFPGEISVPTDVYKRSHEKALRNITVENMEDRLTLLENEIMKEVPEE